MLKILDPRSGPVIGNVVLAPRLKSMAGVRVGILWNGKTYGGDLLNRVASLLKQEHALEAVAFLRKPFIGNLAPVALFDEMVGKQVQFALVGFGD